MPASPRLKSLNGACAESCYKNLERKTMKTLELRKMIDGTIAAYPDAK